MVTIGRILFAGIEKFSLDERGKKVRLPGRLPLTPKTESMRKLLILLVHPTEVEPVTF
jgi:hypothetical protein